MFYEVFLDNLDEKVLMHSDINLNIGSHIILNNRNFYSGVVLKSLKKCDTSFKFVRVVTDNDINTINNNKLLADNCLKEVKNLKEISKLDMSIVDSFYTFDKKQLFFLFVSDSRVDFRDLAKKLADKYKTRIELRQIGVRDKAKRIGGIGPCGLFLCCNSFLTDFNSVSINMAKNQDLALNPTKINGSCGRLLCCLNYENDTYSKLKALAPIIGSKFRTEKGMGKVINVNVFKKTCDVSLEDKTIITCPYKEDESIK